MSPITLSLAQTITARFRAHYPNHNIAVDIPRSDFAAMFEQSGCTGVRLYLCLDDAGDNTKIGVVMVGTDNSGDDMTAGLLKNNVSMCPPNCSEGNELNGL